MAEPITDHCNACANGRNKFEVRNPAFFNVLTLQTPRDVNAARYLRNRLLLAYEQGWQDAEAQAAKERK